MYKEANRRLEDAGYKVVPIESPAIYIITGVEEEEEHKGK